MALVISVFGCEEPQPEPVLNLSFSERFVDPVGDDLALVLSANDNWVAVSEVEWLEVQPQSGEASDSKQDIVITAQENSTGQERIGKVVFRTASLEKTVTLYQKVPSESALRGKGTEASPYIIKTPAHMKEVRERMKQGSTTYICLGADIDMQNVTFYPFNNVSPYNKVIHFDGKGFTISNLTCKEKTYPSIFGIFNGSCCNLNVTDALISTEETSAGIIAASASGPVVLSNVNVSGQVRTEANFVGGLIGVVNDITIDNCAADVSISSLLRYAGGLVGQAKSGKFVVRNSRSSGSVSTNVYVGGLLGFSSKDTAVEIYDSYSTASVKGGGYVGGLAGYLDNDVLNPVKIVNCYATGDINVKSTGSGDVSAFVSNVAAGCEFEDCYATGSVICQDFGEEDRNIGGILAAVNTAGGKSSLKNCTYKGYVKASGRIGGVIGYSKGDITIEDCYAEAEIDALTQNAGGVLGMKDDGEATISRCHFKGTLHGEGQLGGIVGYLSVGTAIISECWTAAEITVALKRYTDMNTPDILDGVGGFVGKSNVHVTITDSSSSVDISAGSSQGVGGLIGIGKSTVYIEDCYTYGSLTGLKGAGGIVGAFDRVTGAEIHTSIAWNKSIASIREQMDEYSTGAVIGAIRGYVTLVDNYRKPDLELLDSFSSGLSDHENVMNSLPPLPEGIASAEYRPYHGKAASPGTSLAALAMNLGWNAEIWDFNSEDSQLKLVIKPLGDNVIEF